MAVTPLLDEAGNLISERIENKYGFSHYVGADAEGKAIKDTQSDFVVRWGAIGRMLVARRKIRRPSTQPTDRSNQTPPRSIDRPTRQVVCGYGRIGKMVCDLLDKKFINYVAFDINPSKVRPNINPTQTNRRHHHHHPPMTEPTDPPTHSNNHCQVIEARNRGLPVFFGDVSRPEVLRSFNVDKARAVVVTTNDMRSTNKAVVTLRKL